MLCVAYLVLSCRGSLLLLLHLLHSVVISSDVVLSVVAPENLIQVFYYNKKEPFIKE
jgi:hypothetical protein